MEKVLNSLLVKVAWFKMLSHARLVRRQSKVIRRI